MRLGIYISDSISDYKKVEKAVDRILREFGLYGLNVCKHNNYEFKIHCNQNNIIEILVDSKHQKANKYSLSFIKYRKFKEEIIWD
jgi:hypothetical protein